MWKFVPLKFVKPPKEFRIMGNSVRQTVMENFVVPIKSVKKKKLVYQSRINKFFQNVKKWIVVFNKLVKMFSVFLFADLKILEGKVALYKKGYHVLLRKLKKQSFEKKKLEKEVKRLSRLVKMHEDMCFYIWYFCIVNFWGMFFDCGNGSNEIWLGEWNYCFLFAGMEVM